MKNFILALVLAVFGAQLTRAQVSTSIEVLPIGVNPTESVMVMPDYFTVVKGVALYGFVEYSGEKGGWFMSHSATWMPTNHVGVYGEVALDDAGGSRASFGPALKPKVPGIASLRIIPTMVFGTPGFDRELKIIWRSNDFPALGGIVWSEGFIRTLRNNGANTYGQPQVWWRKSADSSWNFGLEVEVAGSSRVVRGGFRKVF